MTPVRQTQFAERGNCFSAAMASILELPLNKVPRRSSKAGEDRHWLGRWRGGGNSLHVGSFNMSKAIQKFLENPIWPEGLEARKFYERPHDDRDDNDGTLRVLIADDGDAWISVSGIREGHGLRFRTYAGGGSSLRTRAALLILAEAIRLDNEESAHQHAMFNKSIRVAAKI